jgi:dynein heavy chain
MYFDFETKEWTDPDVNMSTPRWNHSSMLVEAIPSWKFFIFGGEATHFAEGTARSFGEVVNSAAVLDLSTFKWEFVKPESTAVMPSPREYSAMVYDKNQLVIFGGWNNGWLGDMFTLNVSKIVGPPYAITEIDPPLGQLSGGDIVTIRGQGFREGNCNVYFTCGTGPISEPSKLSMSKQANFVNETTLTCETPDFTQFSPRFECVVQLQFSSEDLTTTWKPYTFFMNTRAAKSLCYGAGLLED